MILLLSLAFLAGLLAGFAMLRNKSIQKEQQEKLAARLKANTSVSVLDDAFLHEQAETSQDALVVAGTAQETNSSLIPVTPQLQATLLQAPTIAVSQEQRQLLVERLSYIEALTWKRRQLVLDHHARPTWLVPMQAMAVEIMHEFLVFCETQPAPCPEYANQSLWMKNILEAYACHQQNTLWACGPSIDASEGDLVLQIMATRAELAMTAVDSQDFIEIPLFGHRTTLFLDEDLTFNLSHINDPTVAEINENLEHHLQQHGPADVSFVIGGLRAEDVFVVETAQGRLAWAYNRKKHPTVHLFNDQVLGNEHGIMLSAWYLSEEDVLDVVGVFQQDQYLNSIHIHKKEFDA